MGGMNIRSKLVTFLVAHPGLAFAPEEIAHRVGEESVSRVRDGMGNLHRSKQLPGLQPDQKSGKTVLRWIYIPEHTPHVGSARSSRIFEEVGMDQNGNPILRDEMGKLWRGTPL